MKIRLCGSYGRHPWRSLWEITNPGRRRTAEPRRAPVAWLAPYVFEVGASDHPSFRVFAGAYADSAEASVVHAQFRALGEEPLELVRRLGRYVSRR